jgi:hypothetical protein
MKPLNETLALAHLYTTRDGLRDNPAYEKAEAVLEIRDELAELPELADRPAAELLRLAEMEYHAGEEALAECLGRATPRPRLEIRAADGGLEVVEGGRVTLVPARDLERLIDRARAVLIAEQRSLPVRGRRLEGRLRAGMARPSFRVVAGRKAETAA